METFTPSTDLDDFEETHNKMKKELLPHLGDRHKAFIISASRKEIMKTASITEIEWVIRIHKEKKE